jgi:putative oxidoreductase
MVVAILTVHAKSGPWVTDGGYEYNAVLMAVAFALAGTGPGKFSLDDAIGWRPDITGTGWAFLALAAGTLGGLGALIAAPAAARTAPAGTPAAADGPDERFTRDPDGQAEAEQRRRPGIPADPR